MHYANGREAKAGDPVVGRGWEAGPVYAGIIFALQPGVRSCNAMVTVPVMGGCQSHCITVGDFWHAEDALAAAGASLPRPQEPAPAATEGQGTDYPAPTGAAN